MAVELTIELNRETDGRWIAEHQQLSVLLYGESKQDAIHRAQAAALEIVGGRVAHGELPPDFQPSFEWSSSLIPLAAPQSDPPARPEAPAPGKPSEPPPTESPRQR